MEARPVSLPAYWRLLRSNPNFRLLWLAQIVSEIGDWLYAVSIYSLLLEVTGSAKAVAFAVVLQVLPQVLISPTAGIVNDRISRRKVMIFADVVRSAIVLSMLLALSGKLVWLIYVLLFLETIMWGFFEPGRTAMIPNLTRDEAETAVANGLSATTWSFNLFFGSAVGGAAAVLFGRNWVFAVNAASFLVSALLLRAMKVEEPHAAGAGPLRWNDLVNFSPFVEGLRYVWRDRRLFGTLLAKTGLGCMGAHWVILPILGERTFPVRLDGLDAQRAGMLGMSMLMGARGAGALIGPLVGGYWAGKDRQRLRTGIAAGFAAMALGYSSLSLASTLAAACVAVVLAHAGGSVVWVFSTTLLHFQTEDRFRGRVFSVDFACLMVTMSLATWIGGVAVDLGVSVRTVALTTGLIVVAPAGAWIWLTKNWR